MKRSLVTRTLCCLALVTGCGDGADANEGSSGAASASGADETVGDVTGSEGGDGDGDLTSGGDGDGDPTSGGDGDGDPTSGGDGDGDPTSGGDGDGDPTTGGDGDGDPTTGGDGDGDPTTTGDGDGDPTTGGDGDGDPTTGGDGDGDPTSTSGGDGDGDPTSTSGGDGDGDGDPTSGGDGDGDGDGDTSFCGDGVVDPGEACDDGVETQTCNADCTDASCGDGVLNTTAGEACDDGTLNGQSGQSDCMSGCALTTCGDDYVGASESCDDGNTMDGDGCSSSCQTPCFAEQPTVNVVPPNLVLVLDKSGSMTADFGGATRWDTLVQVVTDVTSTYESVIKFGAKWYPTAEKCENQTEYTCLQWGGPPFNPICQEVIAIGAACEVDTGFDTNQLKPSLNNSNSIVSALPSAADIDEACWTPTQQAFEASLAALKDEVPDPTENRAIMLITDGLISDGNLQSRACVEGTSTNFTPTDVHTDLVASIADAYNTDGIPTYVVAIDAGSGFEAEVEEYAVAGGVPNPAAGVDYYPGDSQAQLLAAMDSIAAAVATCDIQLSVPPLDPSLVSITVDGVTHPQITGADCANDVTGWYFSTQFTTITLCGGACDAFKALSVPTADVEYFCEGGG